MLLWVTTQGSSYKDIAKSIDGHVIIGNQKDVATVDANGKVAAKSKGTAVIYVQTINGIWKTCKVTVK